MHSSRITWLLFLVPAFPLAAQTSTAIRDAAATITPADIQRRINVIADDSMMGRNTPSPGLDQTAQYVAEQFRRFGLKPAGDNGTFFQRYLIARRRFNLEASHVGFHFGGRQIQLGLTDNARFIAGPVPAGEVHAGGVLLGGAFSAEDVTRLDLAGKALLTVIDYSKPLTPATYGALEAAMGRGASAVLLVSNRDTALFRQKVAGQPRERVTTPGGPDMAAPALELRGAALDDLFSWANVDLAAVRASATPVMREIPGLMIGLDLKEDILDSASAPNTVGLLEGSDPVLKREYLVFSAHMDHVGTAGGGECQARGGDTICNGADDDGSGTVSVVELAEAFSRPGARPKRSVLFLTVSGEEKGLWGSSYFTSHPTVPMPQIVADLNIDMVGRNWKDTIVAIGKEHSDLGTTLARVASHHPELHMAPIDDRWPEENFYRRSDHFNFARRGVPILFFFNGVHDDYHQVSDSPDKIEAEKQSRIVKLLFYLGQDIANAAQRPQWNPKSYQEIVEPRPAT
jgi:hypothetical protein